MSGRRKAGRKGRGKKYIYRRTYRNISIENVSCGSLKYRLLLIYKNLCHNIKICDFNFVKQVCNHNFSLQSCIFHRICTRRRGVIVFTSLRKQPEKNLHFSLAKRAGFNFEIPCAALQVCYCWISMKKKTLHSLE